MRPRAVLFDLGNVLCAFDWRRSLSRLASRVPGLDSDAFVDWLLGPAGPHDPYCRGELSTAELLEILHRRLDPRGGLDDAELVRLWNDMFTPHDAVLALVDALAEDLHRGLVSNTNALHAAHLEDLLALRRRFHAFTWSFREGCLKPDPRIYEAALLRARVTPPEALFVDDLEENVAAARALGLAAHRFRSADGLRECLQEHRLLREGRR